MWGYIISFSIMNAGALFIMYRQIMKKIEERQEAQKNEKLDKIFKLYQEIESMMDSFEDYVKEVHEEHEKNRQELNELSRKATTVYRETIERPARGGEPAVVYPTYTPPVIEPDPEILPEPPKNIVRPQKENYHSRLNKKDRNELERQNTKAQKVRFLMSRGFSLEEVAKELNIGKGEVRLIADLDKT